MTWSKQPPTEPGWYWWRWRSDGYRWTLHIEADDDSGELFTWVPWSRHPFDDKRVMLTDDDLVPDDGGEWWPTPIEVPV